MLFSARRRNRRNLASAFIDEIAAAMETVERNDAVKVFVSRKQPDSISRA